MQYCFIKGMFTNIFFSGNLFLFFHLQLMPTVLQVLSFGRHLFFFHLQRCHFLTKRINLYSIFLAKFSYLFLKSNRQLRKLMVNLPYLLFQVILLQSIFIRRTMHRGNIIQV